MFINSLWCTIEYQIKHLYNIITVRLGYPHSKVFFFFFLKRRFIEINKTIYRIVEKKDIRNTFRVKRNEREESMAAMMIIK